MATDVLVNFVQRWLKQAAPKQKGQLLPLPEVPLLSTTLGPTLYLTFSLAMHSRRLACVITSIPQLT